MGTTLQMSYSGKIAQLKDKPTYNPNIHHRRSIRLKGYDYAQAGLYFVTICVQNRECLFGNVVNGEMVLNEAGAMVGKWYNELENKFPDIKCHEMVVMPNHFHCIVENVGADLCVCPDGMQTNDIHGENVGSDLRVYSDDGMRKNDGGQTNEIQGEHIGSPLHRVVQWIKTMTTNEYIRGVKTLGWQPFNRKLWQRNYYEHIIRNGESYQTISNYIINNPAKWTDDKFYTI